jgi:DNA-binding NarL/FixJ family response regulator
LRVLICDDQAIVREGLSLLLALEPDVEVAGTASNGAEAVEQAARLTPDLVLMDLNMPIMNGVEATRQILAAAPATRVLLLTTYDDDEWVFDAIRAGAAGYLLKDTPRADLIKAVRGTIAGRTYVDPAVAGKVLTQVAGARQSAPTLLTGKLSERERDVLRLIAAGKTNAEIAAQLHLSEGTVRNHVSAVLEKLGVSDRTQAAVLALRHGLS